MSFLQNQYFTSKSYFTYSSGKEQSLGNRVFILKSKSYIRLILGRTVRKSALYSIFFSLYILTILILLIYQSSSDSFLSFFKGGVPPFE